MHNLCPPYFSCENSVAAASLSVIFLICCVRVWNWPPCLCIVLILRVWNINPESLWFVRLCARPTIFSLRKTQWCKPDLQLVWMFPSLKFGLGIFYVLLLFFSLGDAVLLSTKSEYFQPIVIVCMHFIYIRRWNEETSKNMVFIIIHVMHYALFILVTILSSL